MSSLPVVARICIYPVKSFDAQSVESAVVLPSGALEWDRRYAVCDGAGEVLNAKRTAAVHRLRSSFDRLSKRFSLRVEGTHEIHTFEMDSQRELLVRWLSDFFGMPLGLIENQQAGLPDDVESPGPTVISTATLNEVTTWFGLSLDDVRARFRANLEIDGVPPFWEDSLVADGTRETVFQIGEVSLVGSNACQRCVVPSRCPESGSVRKEFAKTFAERRRQALPDWAPISVFEHYYRLATNTRPLAGKHGLIAVGDSVVVGR